MARSRLEAIKWWGEDKVRPALARAFPSEAHLPWAVGLSAFLTFSIYRGVLWWTLARASQPPLGIVIERFWFQEFVTASGWDLFVSALLALTFRSTAPMPSRTSVGRLAAALLVVWSAALICVVHFKLLLIRGEYVGFDAAREALFGAMTLQEALGYTTAVDWVMLLAPLPLCVGAFWLMGRLRERGRLMTAAAFATLVMTTLICAVLPQHDKFRPQFHQNPLVFAAIDVTAGLLRPSSALAKSAAPVSPAQAEALQFVDPDFLDITPRNSPERPRPVEEPLDLVVIVMESTRTQEVFRPTPDGSVAMPFLKSLSEESWWMSAHHSTSNSSHRSLFSIFTGLYPSFGRSYFCITDGVAVPTVSSFLPVEYERFLYTPGDLRSYFPRSLLEKTGMNELYGRSDLIGQKKRKATSIALNEFDALEPFLKRVGEAKGPMFAVYYSYVPHFYYRQFGGKYEVMKDLTIPQNRYVNNLRVLDDVIHRIVEQLKSTGRWDKTVLAIVGDHGESFGERGLFTHANDLHEEQVHAPWLLRFPGVTPRVVTELTSHVDILPTLLDTMGISVDPDRFQGESLYSDESRRRYVFGVGNEQSYYSIDRRGTKVIFMDKENRCMNYDLVSDPLERHPRDCSVSPANFQALADFRAFQSTTIQRYSRPEAPNKPPLSPR